MDRTVMLWLLVGAAVAIEPRSLNGHDFALPGAVDAPFVVPHLSLRQGVGYLRVSDVAVDGYATAFTLDLVGVVESLTLQVRLGERVAVYGDLTGELVSGITADSAFLLGARGGAVGELGARVVLHRGQRNQFGARMLVRTRRGISLEPSGLVDAVIEDREATVGSLLEGDVARHVLREERSGQLGIGAAWAHAFHRSVGLIVSTTLRAGPARRDVRQDQELREARGTQLTHTLGLALDVDGGPRVPIGGVLELRNRIEGEALLEDDVASSTLSRLLIAGHVLYTGQRNLQLGLGLTSLTPIAGGRTDRLYTVEAVGRYFFERDASRGR